MLGEPHQVRADAIEPLDLFEDLCVQSAIADTGIRWIAKIVADADAQFGHGH